MSAGAGLRRAQSPAARLHGRRRLPAAAALLLQPVSGRLRVSGGHLQGPRGRPLGAGQCAGALKETAERTVTGGDGQHQTKVSAVMSLCTTKRAPLIQIVQSIAESG